METICLNADCSVTTQGTSVTDRTWWNDYQAARAGGGDSLANWINLRSRTYDDWDSLSNDYVQKDLSFLQGYDGGSGGLYGVIDPFHNEVLNTAADIGAVAGGVGLAYGAGAALADVAGGATAEAGAAGEVATSTGVDASTGLYAGESGYAGTATYGTVGGGATGAALPSASWLDSLINKGIDYGKSKAESTILNWLRGGSGAGTATRNPGAPALVKQNSLPFGNLGAIYGRNYGDGYLPWAGGEFGGGSSAGSSAAPSIGTQVYVWLAVAAVGVLSLIAFSALARR